MFLYKVFQVKFKSAKNCELIHEFKCSNVTTNEEFMPKLWCCLVTQLCLTLFATPMDWNPPGSSVHVISQARILK